MLHARVERAGRDLYNVVLTDGRVWVRDESYAVADNVAEAINHPERWEPTEAYEIAAPLHERRAS